MKRILTIGVVASVMGMCLSCKSEKNTYKAAYEKAVQQEEEEEIIVKEEPLNEVKPMQEQIVEAPVQSGEEVVAPLPVDPQSQVKQEQLQVVKESVLFKRFNVVAGSFQSKDGAESLQTFMKLKGYNPQLMFDDVRGLYRVVVETYDKKNDAMAKKMALKRENRILFEDVWIFEKK